MKPRVVEKTIKVTNPRTGQIETHTLPVHVYPYYASKENQDAWWGDKIECNSEVNERRVRRDTTTYLGGRDWREVVYR